MGPTVVGGLPAHILLVHALLVFVPLSALLTVVHAAWPAAGRRLGVVTPLFALVTLVLVPITTHAGEWLRDNLPGGVATPAIQRHLQLGDGLLPYVAVLFLVSVAVWWYARTTRAAPPVFGDVRRDGMRGRSATVGVTLIALVVSAATVFQLYRIGESGSKAVWGFVVQQQGK
ncbi:MAG: hypothetical protein QOF57_1870 [Frankiaceae bacterium]|nr:hypothetical protein [Frankiaceae bacterium]MDQ1727122.1 hypothetical protein [Frankiaceae bacterium]